MPELKKKLTLYGLTMIAIGSCIGSGIFATPNGILNEVNHQGLALVVWGIGGLTALAGALTLSELGTLFPKAGGVYVYIKEAFGELAGFLYGWAMLLVINTGALAALSLVFAKYMQSFITMTEFQTTALAITTLSVLTVVNILGVSVSQRLSNVFTGLKLVAIAGIIIAGLFLYEPSVSKLNLGLESSTLPNNWLSAMLLAMIGVQFSYGGWHHASYVAGEAKNPAKTVPRAMFLGTLVVTIVYLLANMAYMRLLPMEAMQASRAVASDALTVLNEDFGGKIAAIIISISVFGTVGIYTMSAPRIYFAMARDGVFFKELAKIHPTYGTPARAMLLQAVWAIILILFWGTFHDLISYVVFMDIAFMGLAGVTLFVFRKKLANVTRSYKVWGYPIVPIFFILISAAVVLNTLIFKPAEAGYGLAILAVGIGVYYGAFRKS